MILQALRDHSKLIGLGLNSNNMTGQVAEDLANVIKSNLGLQTVILSDNDLRSLAIVILTVLKYHFKLTVLNLNNNNMTGQVAEDLANVIQNTGLEQLYLSNNDLRSSAIVILEALKDHSKLKVLDLSNSNMTGQVAEDLANVIKNNSGLQKLALSANDLRSSAIVVLQALKDHSKLTVLSLNSNNMS